MCTNPLHLKMKPSPLDLYRGVVSTREVTVPCGKCCECLAKRQNDLSTRVYYEAKSKGCAVFVTLTYDPQFEPYSQSLWCSDLDTGECERLTDASPVVNLSTLDVLRHHFIGVTGFREFDVSLWKHDGKDYFVRYTPTLYYRDVQLALKRFRKNNPDCPDFTYTFVGEYGQNPNGTFRPHYHCVFFGLSYDWVSKFCDEWKIKTDDGVKDIGFVKVKQVNFINRDGSDGLARVSRYVGKYCSKGKFDSCAKRDGLTLNSRLCSSKGLGISDEVKNLKDWFLARDVYDYDPNDVSKLPKEMLDNICERIVSRSFVTVNGYHYALPSNFRRFIFGYKKIHRHSELPSMFRLKSFGFQEKAVYSAIYYFVQEFVRDKLLQTSQEEFKQFIVDSCSKNLREACIAFNNYQSDIMLNREKSKEATILRFYQQHSKI